MDYPDIGIYFADCPSAGHDMIALDYREPGEPRVVHVDQEVDYRITKLAPDFATFVSGLVDDSAFDEM
jgi:SUKH superfamily protein